MAVTGQLTLRNDSKSPAEKRSPSGLFLAELEWHRSRRQVLWNGSATTYTSDIDHTGGLSEAIATLPQAVPPGGNDHAGCAVWRNDYRRTATRLTRMGAPAEIALRNDWDQISESFTAIRGTGLCRLVSGVDPGGQHE